MNLFELFVTLPKRQLTNLRAYLDKATAYAAERKFDANNLMHARLAPDQFAFARQVQSACDSAKGNAARLAGREPPAHADTETTLAQLQERIDTVLAYLDTFTPADFNGAEERKITMGWMRGKHFTGADYIREFALANFFFHVSTSYAILRHNGVPLGKIDYTGPLTFRD
jgi:hypothetical protein